MITIEIINQEWDAGKELIPYPIDRLKFQRWLAKEYVKKVQSSVIIGKYSSKLAPLSPDYYVYKVRNHLNPNQWIATGDLINNLQTKGKNGTVIGFDNRKVHKGSHMRYLKLARTLEYGTIRIPARPLFRLVYLIMRKDIKRYYDRYCDEIDIVTRILSE